MAKLINCSACDKEISKSAKVCPHCGHTNGIQGFRKFINTAFGLFFVAMFTYYMFSDNETRSPTCDSAVSIGLLKGSFNGSDYSTKMKISVTGVINVKEKSVTADEIKRNCSATVIMTDKSSTNVTFELEYKEDAGNGMIFIKTEIVE